LEDGGQMPEGGQLVRDISPYVSYKVFKRLRKINKRPINKEARLTIVDNFMTCKDASGVERLR